MEVAQLAMGAAARVVEATAVVAMVVVVRATAAVATVVAERVREEVVRVAAGMAVAQSVDARVPLAGTWAVLVATAVVGSRSSRAVRTPLRCLETESSSVVATHSLQPRHHW